MKARKSKSAEFYANNPKAREKKKAYDTEYHSTEERRKYRAFLNRKIETLARTETVMGRITTTTRHV